MCHLINPADDREKEAYLNLLRQSLVTSTNPRMPPTNFNGEKEDE